MPNQRLLKSVFIPVVSTVLGLILVILFTFGYLTHALFEEQSTVAIERAHSLTQKNIENSVEQLSNLGYILPKTGRLKYVARLISESQENDSRIRLELEEVLREEYRNLFVERSLNYLALYRTDHLLAGIEDTMVFYHGTNNTVLAKAQQTNGLSEGVVHTDKGGLSLRVVVPWYYEGTCIGYVEIGRQLSDVVVGLTQAVHLSISQLNIDFNSLDSTDVISKGSDQFNVAWEQYIALNEVNGLTHLTKDEYLVMLHSEYTPSKEPIVVETKHSGLSRSIGVVTMYTHLPEPITLSYRAPISEAISQGSFYRDLLTVLAVVISTIIFIIFFYYMKSIEDKMDDHSDKLKKAKDDTDVAGRAQTSFLSNMSQEIRTPLNSIIGFSQILIKRGRGTVLGDEEYKFIENINANGKNLNLLINDVLDLSKIESGRAMVIERDFVIKEFFSNLVAIYKPQALKNRIEFEAHIDPDLPMSIKSDKGKINQILINLITNAIKYTPDGSKIDFSVMQESDSTLGIKIVNHGVEIPEEKRSIIFNPFERVNRGRGNTIKGTGLGLAITKNLVELLGGNIFLTSRDQRTEFTVIIPYKDTVIFEPDFPFAEVQKVFSVDATILIVDENEMNLSMLKNFFEDYNYKIVVARTATDAVHKIHEHHPNIALIDIQLPFMSGLQMIAELREDPNLKRLPVVAMSAQGPSEHKQQAEEMGVNDYISKPIDFDELMVVLEKYLYAKS
ncbi:MAG: response regulator [Fibrobacterales bacterium]